MWNDVVDLRAFYAAPRGQLAARVITQHIRQIWPDLTGQRVLGVGFPIPVLPRFQEEAERVIAAMPAGQGVVRWPEGEQNLTMLTEEHVLPLADRSIDRLLLIHCLEGSSHLQQLMRECWRVLSDGGRLMVVVANRRGLWARSEGSPFAQGRPYSMGQITRLLRDNLFAPLKSSGTLFIPPVWWPLFGRWSPAVEKAGARWFPTFAGLLVVEAEKQIYAVPFERAPARLSPAVVLPKPMGNGMRTSMSCSAHVTPELGRTKPVR